MNNNVFIASGEEHLSLFRDELPGLSYIKFHGFKPGYSRFFPQYFVLLLKTPLLIYHIVLEHLRLKKIIREHAIDIVISDNRFGLWNNNVKTVYITHMLLIPMPKALRSLEFIGVLLHRFIIKKYSLCFVPDLPGKVNLSGRLSHGVKISDNVRYIGILSRFNLSGSTLQENPVKFRHNTVILSGPEPQKGILKQKLSALLKDHDPKTIVFEGNPDKNRKVNSSDNILYLNHLPAAGMKEIITGSENIVARSGYTTIMDLISLNCSALLIPTPGQTEQEYLAGYLSEKGWFSTIPQCKLKEGISLISNKPSLPNEIFGQSLMLLTEALKELLEEPTKESDAKTSYQVSGPNLHGIMSVQTQP